MSFLNEDFSGVTPPAIPATISVDTGIITVGSAPINSNNALKYTGSTGAKFWESASAGNSDGNDYFRMKAHSDSTGFGLVVGMTFSVQATFVGGSLAASTGYLVQARAGGGGGGVILTLYSFVAGSVVALGSLGTNTDFDVDVTYIAEVVRAFDLNGDGWIQIYIQRLSDNKFFRVDQAVWDTGKVYAFSIKNNAISAGASKVGCEFASTNAGNITYHDDLFFDRAKPITLHAWGDSITLGTQADGGGYPLLLGPRINGTVQNHGHGGYQAIDVVSEMYTLMWAGHPCTLLFGVNDATDFGYAGNTTKRDTYYKRALMAGIAQAALPTKQKGTDGTGSGTDWGIGSAYDTNTLRYSVVNGATLTFSGVTGPTIFVGYTAGEAFSGTANVKVDGVTVATIDCSGTGITSTAQQNLAYGPQLLVLTGQGAGSHTVVIECTNTGVVLIDWVAGIDDQSLFNKVQVGNLAHVDTAAVSVYFSSASTLSGANARIDGYNTVIASAISTLAAVGIPVTLVPVVQIVNPTTMLQADGLHWLNTGQNAVSAGFAKAATGFLGF